MNKVSYLDFRLNVLDDFFLCLANKPKVNLTYEEALGYVSYNFESGFNEVENFIVDFVLYVLCSNFEFNRNLSKVLNKRLSKVINSDHFKEIIRQIDTSDKDALLHDLYLSKLISKEQRDFLTNNS